MKGLRAVACLIAGVLISSGDARAGSGARIRSGGWIFPGEYESHQSIWMLWPTYENKAGFPSSDPMSDMIRAMSGRVHVNLAVQDDEDEAAARRLLLGKSVPLGHVHFFQLEHGDIWARDTGPQFTRSATGHLRVNDWNFNYWGYEEPDSPRSLFDEPFDRSAASAIEVPALSQPNTYAPNPDWPACKLLVEEEYRRMLGAGKVIWAPTGVVEDNGSFRGALGTHIRVPRLDGFDIPHAGVYTLFTTNGHSDEFLRFVSPDTVVLAQETLPKARALTPAEELIRWLKEQNHARLERVYDVLSKETTESGNPIRVVRIPMPEPTLEVFQPGDGVYDYFARYDNWEDGSTLPEVMLGVWPASYVNYVPTNDLVLVSRFWKPGRSVEARRKDDQARAVLEALFRGREIAQVYSENVIRGGGGMNCITQQQPASARFGQLCGWAKVQVDAGLATLYAEPTGEDVLGVVPRLTRSGDDVYLERLSGSGRRVQVRVVGAHELAGQVGWVEEDDIESAGEKCPTVYSPN